jgi:hypothetical protein
MQPDLRKYFDMVEDIIHVHGLDPIRCRGRYPGQYNLKRGSVSVWIDISYLEWENRSYFQVVSPIMRLPLEDRRKEYYQEVLEINDGLYGVAFTIRNGILWLKHIRETDSLDRCEIEATLQRIGYYGDKYDRYLKNKYGEGPSIGDDAPGATSQYR